MDMIAMFRGTLGHMRYILKDELKFIPMYGMYFWQVRREPFHLPIANPVINLRMYAGVFGALRIYHG